MKIFVLIGLIYVSLSLETVSTKRCQDHYEEGFILLDSVCNTFGWRINTAEQEGYIFYVNSSLQINPTTDLKLENPRDFDPSKFSDANGIWGFPYTILFENSSDPSILYAYFEGSFTLTYDCFEITYYIHGASTEMCIFTNNDFLVLNFTETDPSKVEWKHLAVDLKGITQNDRAGSSIRLELHPKIKGEDYVLIDKITGYRMEKLTETTTSLPEATEPWISSVQPSSSASTETSISTVQSSSSASTTTTETSTLASVTATAMETTSDFSSSTAGNSAFMNGANNWNLLVILLLLLFTQLNFI